MADTPIDQAANLTSIRLKVPTGTVPVPPPGHLQLHAPDYDTLAVRRGDGSVVEIGGGGGGVATLLIGPGGVIEAGEADPRIGITINATAGTGIAFTGRFLDQYARPLGVQVDTVEVSSAEMLALHVTPKELVAAPGAGRWLAPFLFLFTYHHTTVSYDGAAATRVTWAGAPGGLYLAQQPAANLVGFSADRVAILVPDNLPAFLAAGGVRNQPLVLDFSGAMTGGDGTLTVSTAYLVA